MELIVLDADLTPIHVLDSFESLIWTERYSEYGDFEICANVSDRVMDILKPNRYLWLNGSDQLMIIEGIEIESDAENGNRLTASGRSLESILDRRIVWSQTVLTGNLQDAVQKLLNENVISPSDESRKIDNLIFEASDDPSVTELKIEAQFTGDSLYRAIKMMCDVHDVGFRITLSEDNRFIFKLYAGKDRSYGQFDNTYVVFSPKFENIINSSYITSERTLKTVALVAGEGEGVDRRTTTTAIASGAGSGLDRREMYVDARDISSSVDDRTLTNEEYLAQLAQRGSEYLSENIATESFEGEVDTTRTFKYGEDFFIGDVVQIMNEYGKGSRARVTEIVKSFGPNGIEVFPTFVTEQEATE